MKNQITTRKSFLMYLTWGTNIKKMTVAEKALLLDKLFEFYEYQEESAIPEDMVRLETFWDSIYETVLVPTEEKYQVTAGNRRENIMKQRQYNPKVNRDLDTSNTHSYTLENNISNDLTANVNVKVNAKEKVNVKVDVNGNDDEKELIVNNVINFISSGNPSFKEVTTKFPKLNQYPELKDTIQEYMFSIK